MSRTLRRTLFALVAAVIMIAGGRLMMAQDQPPDPAQIREMRLERIKTQAAVPDNEWEALKPKVSAVMEKQLPMMMGMFGRRGGGGGQGGDQGGGGRRMGMGMFGPQMPEMTELREALSTEGTSDADIKAKLDAFVAAYKKRQAEQKEAQEALAKAVGDKTKLKAVLMMNGLIPVE